MKDQVGISQEGALKTSISCCCVGDLLKENEYLRGYCQIREIWSK